VSPDGAFGEDDNGRSPRTGRVNFDSIQLTLIRIESSIASVRQDVHYLRESQTTRATENERRFNDHEMRLRTIELKRYLEPKSITTVAAIVLPISALAVSIISVVLK
jgi:hypothetical protein